MTYKARWGVVFLAVCALGGGPARAENEGQADLDKATELKLSARQLGDLGEVINLCQSAMQKGLDEQNTVFAKSLLASTLVQRATIAGGIVLREGTPTPLWPQLRAMALDDLGRALELVPEQPDALVLLARLNLLPGGDVKKATAALDKALALKMDMPEERAEALVLRAELTRDTKRQEAMLDEAVKLAPGSAEAIRARGVFFAGRKQYEKAAADLEKAIELAPNEADAYEVLAAVQGELGQYDRAMVSLDKARQLRPNSISPLTLRARIHAQQKNLDAALHDLNEAHAMQPNNVLVLWLRAALYAEQEKRAEALADLDRALALKPDFDRPRRLRAALWADAGKLDEQIEKLEKTVESSPDDLPTRLQLALCYTAAKQPAKAVEAYSAVLAEHPDHAEALEGRANAFLGLGRHAEALADYNKVAKLAPDESDILNNLAWLLATSPDEKGRDGRRAIELAKHACELTGYNEAHILSTLAAGYAETGDFDTAVKWSTKAVELGRQQSSPDVQESLAKELKSYQEKKPWREVLHEGLDAGDGKKPPQGKAAEEKPAEKKPGQDAPAKKDLAETPEQ